MRTRVIWSSCNITSFKHLYFNIEILPLFYLFLGTRVNVSDFRNQEWLFRETTANYDQLLIQYHGFCAYSIGVKGLTLPGMLCSWTFPYYIFTQGPGKM